MSSARQELAVSWRDWNAFIRTVADLRELHPRLVPFSAAHQAEAEHIKRVTTNLARGQALVAAAIEWHEPAIAQNMRPSAADRARGLQWRLVMAYGGLETITKTLLVTTGRGGLTPDDFTTFVSAAIPPAPSCPRLPRRRRELEDWLLRPANGATNPVIEFLGLERGDAAIIETWLISGGEINSWAGELRLAKALRNATAHGALTSSRACKWGIDRAFNDLTLDIGRLVAAVFRRLQDTI